MANPVGRRHPNNNYTEYIKAQHLHTHTRIVFSKSHIPIYWKWNNRQADIQLTIRKWTVQIGARHGASWCGLNAYFNGWTDKVRRCFVVVVGVAVCLGRRRCSILADDLTCREHILGRGYSPRSAKSPDTYTTHSIICTWI